MSAYQELLEVGLELVNQAGLIAMKYWRKEMSSELKSDGSTVTQVDLMIENMMRQTIKTLYPDHTII
jgi:fructose-1,6-bisphosphatase/inositol monophosphatase family enzyme